MIGSKGENLDIIGIVLLLWSKKRRIIINCFIGGVLAIILAYSIPKEYTSEVVMVPEFSTGASSFSGGISSLVSMAGIDLSLGGGEDAFYPELYPQIISSAPFLCDLLQLTVTGHYRKKEIETDLYHYLDQYQRKSWWSWLFGIPGKMIRKLMDKSGDTMIAGGNVDFKHLSRKQQILMKSLDKKIRIDVDKGTNVISLKVTMQDPEIAVDVVQTVSDNLQKYIADYRSAKARKDYEYTEQLYNDAQRKYLAAQERYAQYSDQHKGIVKMQYQIEADRLQNEQDLTFGIYNQLAQQLALAKAKVQEHTPVSVVMQPAVVPYKASSPKKMMMGILYVFLAFFGTCAWYIVKECISDRRTQGR